MMKVAFYARVSTTEVEQLDALDNQVSELTEFVRNQENWCLVDAYVDQGISGTSTKGRHEYNRLFSDLSTDKFDILVIKDVSRLARNVLTWYQFLQKVQDNGKKLYLYLDKSFYTPEDKFLLGIKAILAEEYSRDLSKKINSAVSHSQKNGTVYGNGRMLGYEQKDGKMTIIEEEAEIVRQIFQWYIQGNGVKKISNLLYERGIYSNNGTKFSLTTLKRMIRNEKYKGLLISGKRKKDFETKKMIDVPPSEWTVIEGGVPAIVDKDTWDRANACMNSRISEPDEMFKKRGAYKSNNYPLSQRIICGVCGRTFYHDTYVTKVGKQRREVWRCGSNDLFGHTNSCGNYTIRADELNAKLKSIIMNISNEYNDVTKAISLLKEKLSVSKDNNTNVSSLYEKQNKLTARLDGLLNLLLDGTISKEEYISKKESIENQLITISAEIENEMLSKREVTESLEDKLKMIEEFLKKPMQSIDEISDDSIRNVIDKIIINNDGHIIVKLSYGEEIDIPYKIKFKRCIDISDFD